MVVIQQRFRINFGTTSSFFFKVSNDEGTLHKVSIMEHKLKHLSKFVPFKTQANIVGREIFTAASNKKFGKDLKQQKTNHLFSSAKHSSLCVARPP